MRDDFAGGGGAGFPPSLRGLGWLLFPLTFVQWWLLSLPAIRVVELLVFPEQDLIEIFGFFFVLLLCVGANRIFSGSGPWRMARVGGFLAKMLSKLDLQDLARISSTRPSYYWCRPFPVMVITRRVRVIRSCSVRDQHAPRVFSPWSCTCVSPFASPVSVGDDLDF